MPPYGTSTKAAWGFPSTFVVGAVVVGTALVVGELVGGTAVVLELVVAGGADDVVVPPSHTKAPPGELWHASHSSSSMRRGAVTDRIHEG
jgi:hypothetical protein